MVFVLYQLQALWCGSVVAFCMLYTVKWLTRWLTVRL